MTDILREAVEHLCEIHEGYEQYGTVATLRALRDALDERLNFEEALKDENKRLREAELGARIQKLEGALRPLAAMLKPHHEGLKDNVPIFGIESAIVTVGDFRRARAALSSDKD